MHLSVPVTICYFSFSCMHQNTPFQQGDPMVFVLLLSRVDKILKYLSKIKEKRIFPEYQMLQLTMNIHCQERTATQDVS